MPNRRHRLAQRRRTVGLSQERLAEVVGVDRSTVVRWERADTAPQPWHRPRLAEALRLSIEELADLLMNSDAGSGAVPPAYLPLDEVSGMGDLGALYSLRNADGQVGGWYLYATVAAYLRRSLAPRLFGQITHTDGYPVFVAAAGLTELAGWMAHDAGQDSLAAQHFHSALGLAHAGRDTQLSAHICGSLSHLAHCGRRADLADAYARQGHDELGAGPAHPVLAARLHAMQARGYADHRDEDRCIHHLRLAERALAGSPDESPSPWVNGFDEASLAAEAARCFRQLGHLGAARRQVELVVKLRPVERARSRAFALLMSASILIAERRVDEACVAVREVLGSTRALGSTVVVRQLAELSRRLAPFRQQAEVAAVLDCLDLELRERQWLTTRSPASPDRTWMEVR